MTELEQLELNIKKFMGLIEAEEEAPVRPRYQIASAPIKSSMARVEQAGTNFYKPKICPVCKAYSYGQGDDRVSEDHLSGCTYGKNPYPVKTIRRS